MEEAMASQNENESPKDVNSAMGLPEMLLANPDLLRRVGSVLAAMNSAQPKGVSVGEPIETEEGTENVSTQNDTGGAPMPAPSMDLLGSLLSNPALLEKLPQMLAVMKPLLSAPPPPKKEEPHAHSGSVSECRDRLLLALKPFLTPARREAVDSILRISHLGSIFTQLK